MGPPTGWVAQAFERPVGEASNITGCAVLWWSGSGGGGGLGDGFRVISGWGLGGKMTGGAWFCFAGCRYVQSGGGVSSSFAICFQRARAQVPRGSGADGKDGGRIGRGVCGNWIQTRGRAIIVAGLHSRMRGCGGMLGTHRRSGRVVALGRDWWCRMRARGRGGAPCEDSCFREHYGTLRPCGMGVPGFLWQLERTLLFAEPAHDGHRALRRGGPAEGVAGGARVGTA